MTGEIPVFLSGSFLRGVAFESAEFDPGQHLKILDFLRVSRAAGALSPGDVRRGGPHYRGPVRRNRRAPEKLR